MKYKVLAVDVDGTLEHEKGGLSEKTLQTLRGLQQRGVVVIVATGRGPFSSLPKMLSGFTPDYRVCVNGGCVLDCHEKVLHERRMDLPATNALTKMAQKKDLQLCFSFEDAYYFYTGYQNIKAHYAQQNAKKPSYMVDGSDGTRHAKSLPYGGFIILPPERNGERVSAPPSLKAMQSSPGSFDICPQDNDKAEGLAHLLRKLDVSWEQVVSIGDSENDLGMLRAAGMGVAMGNAVAHVKSAADYVTGSVLQDGVVQAVERFF